MIDQRCSRNSTLNAPRKTIDIIRHHVAERRQFKPKRSYDYDRPLASASYSCSMYVAHIVQFTAETNRSRKKKSCGIKLHVHECSWNVGFAWLFHAELFAYHRSCRHSKFLEHYLMLAYCEVLRDQNIALLISHSSYSLSHITPVSVSVTVSVLVTVYV